MAIFAALLSALVVTLSCSKDAPVNGSVLARNQCISAKNKNGIVRICYVDPHRRRYEWDGKSQIIKMKTRRESFEGKRGLYEPAASLNLPTSEERLVLQESSISFGSYDEIYRFLWRENASMDWVYTNDGLVVGIGRDPSRNQVNFDVWQVLVNGKPPTELRGSRPSNIWRETRQGR